MFTCPRSNDFEIGQHDCKQGEEAGVRCGGEFTLIGLLLLTGTERCTEWNTCSKFNTLATTPNSTMKFVPKFLKKEQLKLPRPQFVLIYA